MNTTTTRLGAQLKAALAVNAAMRKLSTSIASMTPARKLASAASLRKITDATPSASQASNFRGTPRVPASPVSVTTPSTMPSGVAPKPVVRNEPGHVAQLRETHRQRAVLLDSIKAAHAAPWTPTELFNARGGAR